MLAALAFVGILAGGAASPSAAECPAGSADYRTYQGNIVFERFDDPHLGATVCYPTRVFPAMSPSRDGFRFTSDDGLSWFSMSGAGIAPGTSTREVMALTKRDLMARSASITYERSKGDWFVLSGHDGDRIYYQRTEIDGDQSAANTLFISIPVEQKSFYQDIIARMSWSFRSR
ncbi:hypothetical protein [Skermanella stibiiresistens]|uniref:hypothetical protein n=1 Tax=Skermanella stibiiresistens TaxID=913326 RepID=UPI0004BAEB3C|nr:hypothetical protein [Skermanella stibiiresistens]